MFKERLVKRRSFRHLNRSTSRHYANRTPHRVRSLKVAVLVDIETQYLTNIYCTTTKKHNAKIDPQVDHKNAIDLRSLAADRGYDS